MRATSDCLLPLLVQAERQATNDHNARRRARHARLAASLRAWFRRWAAPQPRGQQ